MNPKTNHAFRFASVLSAVGLTLALVTPIAAQRRQPVAVTPATEDEARSLAFMREEEKLARDVYQALHERWQLRVFDNISRSEERHFASIGTLLTRYHIDDPARNDIPGVYVNPDLTVLYSELMSKGLSSLKDALEVGVMIEKHDIADLETAIQSAVKTDIKRVYANLLSASLDHLEAFEANLECLAQVP